MSFLFGETLKTPLTRLSGKLLLTSPKKVSCFCYLSQEYLTNILIYPCNSFVVVKGTGDQRERQVVHALIDCFGVLTNSGSTLQVKEMLADRKENSHFETETLKNVLSIVQKSSSNLSDRLSDLQNPFLGQKFKHNPVKEYMCVR